MTDYKQYVKVKYSTESSKGNEYGWVRHKKDNHYKVANIPFFAENLNIDDVVTIKKDDGGNNFIDKIIKRKYHNRTVFSYSEIADYKLLIEKHESDDLKIEGGWTPSVDEKGKFKKGMAVIASNLPKKDIQKMLNTVKAKIISHIEML